MKKKAETKKKVKLTDLQANAKEVKGGAMGFSCTCYPEDCVAHHQQEWGYENSLERNLNNLKPSRPVVSPMK
jgi:hypothetical protein